MDIIYISIPENIVLSNSSSNIAGNFLTALRNQDLVREGFDKRLD